MLCKLLPLLDKNCQKRDEYDTNYEASAPVTLLLIKLLFMTTVIERKKLLTLDEFTTQQLHLFSNANGQSSSVMRDIGLAAKRINGD